MLGERVALGDFQRGPQPIARAGGGGVGGADDDVAGERVLPEHVIKGGGEFVFGDLPGDERPLGEIGRHQSLTDATDGAGPEHGPDALNDGLRRDAGQRGDLAERVGVEALQGVFGDAENGGVDGVVNGGGDGVRGGGCGDAHAVIVPQSGCPPRCLIGSSRVSDVGISGRMRMPPCPNNGEPEGVYGGWLSRRRIRRSGRGWRRKGAGDHRER